MLRYLTRRRGPLTSNVGEGGAFVSLHDDTPTPDVQFHFVPSTYLNEGLTEPTGHGMTLSSCLLRPRSTGQLTLKGPDPRWAPLLEPRYLDDPADVATFMAGFEAAMEVLHQPALRPWRGTRLIPPPSARVAEQIHDAARAQAQTLYHPVGTCAMGTHPDAVVDPEQLRVRGLDGLRVVDASVMPDIVGGNTNAPVIMIAEKAADLIRARTT